MSEAKRDALEKMGPARVRHLLSQGMLVHHLIQPAYEWLDELAAKEKPDAVDEGIKPIDVLPEHPRNDQIGPSASRGEGGGGT